MPADDDHDSDKMTERIANVPDKFEKQYQKLNLLFNRDG